jgi:hypothetical protein
MQIVGENDPPIWAELANAMQRIKLDKPFHDRLIAKYHEVLESGFCAEDDDVMIMCAAILIDLI